MLIFSTVFIFIAAGLILLANNEYNKFEAFIESEEKDEGIL